MLHHIALSVNIEHAASLVLTRRPFQYLIRGWFQTKPATLLILVGTFCFSLVREFYGTHVKVAPICLLNVASGLLLSAFLLLFLREATCATYKELLKAPSYSRTFVDKI